MKIENVSKLTQSFLRSQTKIFSVKTKQVNLYISVEIHCIRIFNKKNKIMSEKYEEGKND
jgi:hypothetical protein